MNKTEPIKITIEGGYTPNKTLQLTLPPDSSLEEWVDAFKTILVFQTFIHSHVEEIFATNE